MSSEPTGRISYYVTSLADLEAPKYEVLKTAVREELDSFVCERSKHLQDFARGKVHGWENHGHSRTYVLVSAAPNGGIDVPAFFTIGMTSLDFSRATKGVRSRLMGNIPMEHTGAYTIAELARSDAFTSDQLPGDVILDEAKAVIRQSRELIAGRFLVVDAQEAVFTALYEPAGFRRLGIAEAPRGMEDKDFVTGISVIKDW